MAWTRASRMPQRGPAAESEPDEGMTLIELLVAMGIFTVVISVFLASLVGMTRTTTRAQVVADAGDELRQVFQRLDKEVRYASAINMPGAGSVATTRYVEFRTTAVPQGESPLCTQWRYDASTRELATRTWKDSATPGITPWLTVATRVRNSLSSSPAQEPFTTFVADGVNVRQRLSVDLYAGPATGAMDQAGAEVHSVFVARNSSIASGVSVCLATGGRP